MAATRSDVDAEFIFLWISFNALYGTPRYRNVGRPEQSEIDDFKDFLVEVERVSPGLVKMALKGLNPHVNLICESPFLDIECWRKWDHGEIRDRDQRVGSVRVISKDPDLGEILTRIYTLRNQVLHGAATDQGRRNRESLAAAIPIMRAVMDVLIQVVEKCGTSMIGLDPIPFPPSLGESKPFNAPRLTRE